MKNIKLSNKAKVSAICICLAVSFILATSESVDGGLGWGNVVGIIGLGLSVRYANAHEDLFPDDLIE